ncbi:MAG: P-loop NTPase fold protein [Fusobacteriaceae bacterium]
MKTVEENKKRYKTLKVDSRGEDKLDGSHTKIAKEISACIKDNDIKIIGLEGEWGSGKSNVIEIMKKNFLTAEKKYYFFTFDTWGHQEDLQRRAFLQELIEDLVEKKFIKEEWKTKKLEDILSNKTLTKTKELLQLSKTVIIIAIILFFNKVFSYAPDRWLRFESVANFCSTFPMFLKNILIGLEIFIEKNPVLFLASSLWIILPCMRKKLNLAELFNVFTGKISATNLEVSTLYLEPSINDFKDWMEKLSKVLNPENIKSEEEKVKLVIVFDNMDRLPPEKVKEIWSLVHTFFAEKTYDKIWVLVPFSASHLKKAFDSDDEKTEDNSQGFVNKTFPIVYRVTPPILKSWKDFFRDRFIEIFESDFENNFDRIEVIYNYLETNKTPRNIILFINKLATLKNLYHEIDFDIITYYILKKDVIDEGALLNKNDKCKDVFKFFDGRFHFGNLAALYFGTTKENATHILLESEINSAFSEGDFKSLEKIKDFPGFYHVLKNIIIYQLKNPDKAVIAMKYFDAVEPYKTIFIKLKDSILGKNFLNKNITFEEYHKILIDKFPECEEEILRKVLSVPFENKDAGASLIIETIFNKIFEVESFLVESFSKFNITDLLPENKVSTIFFINFIFAAEKLNNNSNGEFLNHKYKIKTAQDLLEHHLMSGLTSYNYQYDREGMAKYIQTCNKIIVNVDYNFDRLKDEIKKYTPR